MDAIASSQAARAWWLPSRALAGSAVRGAWLRGAGVLSLLTLLTVLFTWPLATGLSSLTVWHIDPPFSVWRIAWVAHQLFIDPAHLFDGNIFYPEPRTLGYSDAMLAVGLMGTPFIKAGVPPLLVMNLLLFAGIIGSGAGMYLLARRLTGSTAAAILAAVIFAFAPYRADHLMHLELQWAAWIPLTLWAFHRTICTGRMRDGVLTGVFLLLQLLSSIYYALFLAAALVIAGIVSLIAWRRRLTMRAMAGLALGAVLLGAVALPYSQPYRENVKALGNRPEIEIKRYSATPDSYLSVTPEHAFYGEWTGDWSESEARLFPGAIAILLGLIALLPPVCATRWLYVAVLAFAVDGSFGLDGRLYPLLHEWLTPFKGLRAPGRFGILVLAALGVLAAYGAARVLKRVPARWQRSATILLGGLMMLEYQIAPPYMETLPVETPTVYRWLAREPRTVTIEFPVPRPDAMPYVDPYYMYFATQHWQPLVNGYSGHYPASYVSLLETLKKFPRDEAIDALHRRGVGAIILHGALYEVERDYDRAVDALAERSDVKLMGVWKDHRGEARAYKLLPRARAGR